MDQFLFGSKSNFDDFYQEVVKELREDYSHSRRVYVRMYYPELGEPYIGYILRDFVNKKVFNKLDQRLYSRGESPICFLKVLLK